MYLRLSFLHDRRKGNAMCTSTSGLGHPESISCLAGVRHLFQVGSTFSGKPLFGYRPWLPHLGFVCCHSLLRTTFSPMGQVRTVNGFSVMRQMVIPCDGRQVFTGYSRCTAHPFTVRSWSIGFMVTRDRRHDRVLMAVLPRLRCTTAAPDAHFHNVIIGARCSA